MGLRECRRSTVTCDGLAGRLLIVFVKLFNGDFACVLSGFHLQEQQKPSFIVPAVCGTMVPASRATQWQGGHWLPDQCVCNA